MGPLERARRRLLRAPRQKEGVWIVSLAGGMLLVTSVLSLAYGRETYVEFMTTLLVALATRTLSLAESLSHRRRRSAVMLRIVVLLLFMTSTVAFLFWFLA
jgi:glucan phosphoethanolaminetransferase (alkaline phosphatase superfamily)